MSEKKIDRDVLEKHLASTLDINRFRDYCPNGLQVEGREQIQYVVSGVTASLALIEAALEKGRIPCSSIMAISGKARILALSVTGKSV